MTDSQTPETTQGPADRRATGGHDDDASGSRVNDRSAEEAGGHTIPIVDEQPDSPHGHEEDQQGENAETSLHQPSEG